MSTVPDSEAAIRQIARAVTARGQSAPREARDPVNLPAIRNWTDAMGDANPLYTDAEFAAGSAHGQLVAPPAMVQVWTMPGLQRPAEAGPDPLGEMMLALDDAGFTSVVATNCDQTYYRYLRHGELLSLRSELADVSGPKRTALGEGWFVTTRNVWYSGDEQVASMDWRVLKYRPASQDQVSQPVAPPDLGPIMRPAYSLDTEFFWAGTAIGELRVQRCGLCGALRHPPGPACLACGATEKQDYQVAAGTGTVYSYVVHRHPPVPGKQLPIVIALVELTEGVRMLGELHGVDPEQVRIGLPVRVDFARIDDELVLPAWREDRRARPGALPELVLEVTPTLVVSTAIATRDFYPVHHDRDFAVRTGSRDIFLNILTSTGLVERYVTDWAGPEAIVRSISIRLGVPCYAGDTLTFSGEVTESDDGGRVVAVTGACSLGSHVTGTVRLGGRA
ncbi:MAG TPA: OB-fold domain-containing protein [Streptosporangiaceae bacterium]|nr:OB-fold domain-containing protein [Streptosporangiaceae bacterium]